MKKILRKIHLWLSVPFGIFITLICFSGAMLVFEKEITELCRHDIYFVKEVKENPLPLDSLMKRVCATLPDSVTVTGVTVSPDTERTWQVSLSQPRRASLYVNPYTGEVTGRGERLPFYDTMFHLHRWMMGSSTGIGKLLVGTSTMMLVIILITGILMWLTNKNKPLRRSLTVSFTKGWPHFWHDLHVAGGIYTTLFLLAIALTGLTWSFSWYRTGFYSLFGVESSTEEHRGHGGNRTTYEKFAHGRNDRPQKREYRHDKVQAKRDTTQFAHGRNDRPQKREYRHDKVQTKRDTTHAENMEKRKGRHREENSTSRYAHHHRPDSSHTHSSEQKTNIAGDSSANHSDTVLNVPYHRQNGRTRHGNGKRKASSRRNKPIQAETQLADVTSMQEDSVVIVEQSQISPFAHWQEVYKTLVKSYPDYRQITLSEGSASVVPAGRNSLRAGDRFDFDIESGKITGCIPYSNQDKSTHVRSAIYMVHVGSWGGFLTRIITFFAALLGATLPLTGYYLWIKRLHGKSKHSHQRPKV